MSFQDIQRFLYKGIPMLVAFAFLFEVVVAQEEMRPCTRRTDVVLSEIHYHPANSALGNEEFIELYNSSPISVDLGGWKLSGEVDFEIPEGVQLGGGQFLIIAADPTLTMWMAVGVDVLGPWTGSLSNSGGTVRVRKASGGIVLETQYDDRGLWPLAPDGAGHSLVLRHQSYGESQARAWTASLQVGGSPGSLDPAPSEGLDEILVSEVLSATAPEDDDFLEFYNPTNGTVDLSGCFISNDRDILGYQIPEGTLLASNSYRSFVATTLGFVFEETGDEIFLRAPDGLRVLTARSFLGQEIGHSWGGLGEWSERLFPTPGAANSGVFRRSLVINEIHYHPTGGESGEFLEIKNSGVNPVNVSNWTIRGGVDFVFPEGVVISDGDFLVIAKDRVELMALYSGLNAEKVIGNYSGSLSDRGESVELRTDGNLKVDEVCYFDGGRWPSAPDGGGTSLQLKDARADNSIASAWEAGDESGQAQSVVIEHTGVLDLGHQRASAATRFFVMLNGEGEVIVDDIEVIVNGGNVLTNGDFASGLAGWKLFGTHRPSSVEGTSLHVRASDGGDLANLIESTFQNSISPGTTVTIRATCRWVSGCPDILMGLNGGWLEAAGTLPVPVTVGTPGAENFGIGNVGPAISEVSHFPLLPQAGEPITIKAKVTDPDGVASVRIRYRLDPGSSTLQVLMTHSGRGIYTGVIPGQSTGKMVAFHLLTIDSATPGVISRFPSDAPTRECLVKVGEVTPTGDFSTMRIWVTDANFTEWRDRERSSNLPLDSTFVSDGRVFYNAGVHYAGSQNGVTIYNSPTGNAAGYNVSLPADEVFLNVQKLTLDRETTRDATRQRERLLFWFLEKLRLPNLHRRYVHVYLNGVKRDELIMEDVQKPNGDVMEQWFPGKGRLTKTNPWFEFDADGNVMNGGGAAITNRLEHFRTNGGALKIPRYRWTWSHGAGHESAHDFSGISSLIDAAESSGSEFVSRMRGKADLRNWMRTFAMNDLGSYWDTFGNPGSKNAYLHESMQSGKWSVVVWDMDVGLGVLNDPYNAALFPANVDPNIARLYQQPEIVRDYWQAMDESLKGFFTAAGGSEARAILAETYSALQANGAAVTSPFVPSGPEGLSVDNWIHQRRAFLQGEIAGKDAPFSASGPISSATIYATLTGTIPLAAVTLTVNDLPINPSFSTITAWSGQVALRPGMNDLLIEARDSEGDLLGTRSLQVNYTGSERWPALAINEWMASNPVSTGIVDPADGQSDDWFELYNPTANPVSLEGWYLSDDPAEHLKFAIPDGFVIPANGFILVWADDEEWQNDPAVRQEIHTSFKLSAAGEALILTAPDATDVDRVDFENQTSGVARIRLQDGGSKFGYTLISTPGATNGNSVPGMVVEVNSENHGDEIGLNFPSQVGVIYELEISSDLLGWSSAAAPIIGSGAMISLRHPLSKNRQFFRIHTH